METASFRKKKKVEYLTPNLKRAPYRRPSLIPYSVKHTNNSAFGKPMIGRDFLLADEKGSAAGITGATGTNLKQGWGLGAGNRSSTSLFWEAVLGSISLARLEMGHRAGGKVGHKGVVTFGTRIRRFLFWWTGRVSGLGPSLR